VPIARVPPSAERTVATGRRAGGPGTMAP
jgi:hypothetical protein